MSMDEKRDGRARIFSLDLLRGLDIFLLTAVGPLVWAIHRTWGDYDNPAWWLDQVKHPMVGFSLWDIIMPLFLFMSGAAVPLGFSKRLDANGRPTREFWTHLVKRFLLLWVLSVFTHGNLCAFDPEKTHIFAGALFVIAVAMVFVSLWMLIPSRRVQVVLPIVLYVAYAATRQVWDGCKLPMLMYAGVVAPAGALAVQYIRGAGSGGCKALMLAGLGAALLAFGWGLSPWVPMSKRLMSASFTPAALGWCLLALAACYYLADVKGWRRGTWIFTLYGQCSLVAYVIDEQFRPTFRAAAEPFIVGFPQWFGPKYQEMFLWVFMIAIQTFVLYLWRESRRKEK